GSRCLSVLLPHAISHRRRAKSPQDPNIACSEKKGPQEGAVPFTARVRICGAGSLVVLEPGSIWPLILGRASAGCQQTCRHGWNPRQDPECAGVATTQNFAGQTHVEREERADCVAWRQMIFV